MTSPAVSSNPSTNSDRARVTRKKKKKQTLNQSPKQGSSSSSSSSSPEEKSQPNWKSESQKRIYSSRLLKAIRHVSTGSGSAQPTRGRAVREAADMALAATAKGRSRWSRAVLTSRLKLKFRKRSSNRARASPGSGSGTGNGRSKKPRVSVYGLKGKGLPAVQRKARVLGRLVPGCRKQPLPVILEETHDYIEAKHMQIRAMIELLERLGSASSPPPPPPM